MLYQHWWNTIDVLAVVKANTLGLSYLCIDSCINNYAPSCLQHELGEVGVDSNKGIEEQMHKPAVALCTMHVFVNSVQLLA